MPLSIPRVVPTCMQQCSCTCCSGMPYLCVHVLSSTACRCTCLNTPYSFVFTSMNYYRYATNIYKHMQWEGPVQHSSHSRPQGATDDQSTTVITCHNLFCKDPEILMWVTQCCSSWGPGVETRLPLAVGTCTLGLRTQMGASSSLIRANSLLSNLSARRARMVAPAPWPGSCSSGDSCLMVVNTNCSVDAKRERPRRERTAHTHKQDNKSVHTDCTSHSTSTCQWLPRWFVCVWAEMRLMPAYDGCKPEQLLRNHFDQTPHSLPRSASSWLLHVNALFQQLTGPPCYLLNGILGSLAAMTTSHYLP